MYPTLWVGRTVFSRAHMPILPPVAEPRLHGPPSFAPDLAFYNETKRAMRSSRGRAATQGTSSTPEVDGGRDQVHHPGGHEDRTRTNPSKPQPHDDERAQGLGPRAPRPPAGQEQPQHDHETHPRPGGGSRRPHHESRALQGVQVETPPGYRRWAIAEVESNSNASEDLRMFANWATTFNFTAKDQASRYANTLDWILAQSAAKALVPKFAAVPKH